MPALIVGLLAIAVVLLVGRLVMKVAWRLVIIAIIAVAVLGDSNTGVKSSRARRGSSGHVVTDCGQDRLRMELNGSMGCSRWRTPITSSVPSSVSVVALTTNSSGTSSAISEW